MKMKTKINKMMKIKKVPINQKKMRMRTKKKMKLII